MSFTAANIDAPSGFIRLPWSGLWTARATLSTEDPPARGEEVIVVAGSLTLRGYVRSVDVHSSVSEVDVVAGRGGWRRTIATPQERADNGVLLSKVVLAYARLVGESLVLETGADRVLGYAWTTPTGPASTALHEVTSGAWWVDNDGVAHVGARPAGSAIAAAWSLMTPPGAGGFMSFTSPDDDFASFPVSGILSGNGLASDFPIRQIEIRWGHGTAKMIAWRTP